MSYSSLHEPTSRLCFKNIPETMTEETLRQKIITETKKSGVKSQSPMVEITDIKILRVNGKSRRMAFVGFKNIDQSKLTQFYWNKAYMHTSRVFVEFASLPNSNTVRAWSKYSAGSSANPETKQMKAERQQEKIRIKEEKTLAHQAAKHSGRITDSGATAAATVGASTSAVDQVKRNKMQRALEMHPILFGLGNEQREKVLANPKFHDYVSMMVDKKSKDRKFWDNDDQSRETNALRALYVATHADEEKAAEDPSSGKDYEALMEQMRKDGKSKKSDDSDDDDDDYFSNPSLDAATEFSSSADEQKDMLDVVQNILKNKVANKKDVSDSDYFNMMSNNFDSDSEVEGVADDDIMDDEDDDDVSATSSRKRSRSDGDDEPRKTRRSDATDGEDDEEDSKLAATKTTDKATGKHKEYTDEDARSIILDSGKLFVRRLPFSATADEIRAEFEQYGSVKEVQLPTDMHGLNKGFAYIHYTVPDHAVQAYRNINGQVFQGRIVHILPGLRTEADENDGANPLAKFGDDELRKMSYKTKKQLMDRAQAGQGHNWNSMFISSDTISNAVSYKFNIDKSVLLGANQMDEDDSIGVRMAVAETHMINETKTFLEEYGVILDKFNSNSTLAKSREASKNTILVKNIPFDTEESDLRKVFKRYGPIARLILPPYKTMAILEYSDSGVAKKAFMAVAYKKFKNVPLYLEWAPEGCLRPIGEMGSKGSVVIAATTDVERKVQQSEASAKADSDDDEFDKSVSTREEADRKKAAAAKAATESEGSVDTRSIFVKNIHFDSKEDDLREAISRVTVSAWKNYCASLHAQGREVPDESQAWRVRAVVISKRTVSAKSGMDKNREVGDVLSLGYGFVEMSSPSAAAGVVSVADKQRGITLDGHLLDLRVSSRQDNTSILNADLKKKTILVQKGLLSEEKQQEQIEWSKTSSKLIVRNVPFEANAKELRELFMSFGQLKRVKLPQKGTGQGHRGFAFVDFVTAQEARNAFNSLQNTHLYGRHLVLEWAKPDETLEALREKTRKQMR